MPGDARQMAPLRPAAVAIHDDGDVLREPVRIKFTEQPLFFEVRGFERFRCFTRLFLRIPCSGQRLFREHLEKLA